MTIDLHDRDASLSGEPILRATTILAVRRGDRIAVGGDGQVTLGNTVMKGTACKIRRLHNDKVIVGFAGGAADAFALLERFEGMLDKHQGNTLKAAIELAKEWRTDRALRPLKSTMIVADHKELLLLSGNGDVIQPDEGVLAIGSGGPFAAAAARALVKHTELDAVALVRESLQIAADICIYTNDSIHVEELP
ncbi:MAG: ATP-dependent protease subunit HslV [Gemmatimonadota bacterium]|nr:MAG: ATP-dependent protease subunit HslV [Gemmatimonadota bacterium]